MILDIKLEKNENFTLSTVHKYYVVIAGIWLPRYKNKIKHNFLWLSAIILTKETSVKNLKVNISSNLHAHVIYRNRTRNQRNLHRICKLCVHVWNFARRDMR